MCRDIDINFWPGGGRLLMADHGNIECFMSSLLMAPPTTTLRSAISAYADCYQTTLQSGVTAEIPTRGLAWALLATTLKY